MVVVSAVSSLFGYPISGHVARFGHRALTTRWIAEEVLWGLLLVLPICLLISQSAKRLVVRRKPAIFSSNVYVIVFVVGDLLLEAWWNSVPGFSSTPDIDNSAAWTRFLRRWGFQCASPLTHNDELLLAQGPTVLLLGIRLFFISVGTYLGQTFVPVALTGSIATGKSTVAKMILEPKPPAETSDRKTTLHASRIHGLRKGTFRIIDTDRIGHEILLSPSQLARDRDHGRQYMVVPRNSVYPNILKAFGDNSVGNKNILDDDGQIDRRKLGDVIFQDRSKRRVLNRITHPRIIRVMLQQLVAGTFLGKESIVCADVPLLFESGLLRWLFGLTIVVACDPDLQFRRLCSRNPDLTEQQCRDRIASQIPIERKVALADIVIWNNGTLHDLSEEVERAKKEAVERLHGVRVSLLHYLVIVGGALLVAASLKID